RAIRARADAAVRLLSDDAAATLRAQANVDLRSGRYGERCGCGDQELLADVDDVVAMTAEVRLAADDARKHVRLIDLPVGAELDVVRLDAHAHRLAGPREFAVPDVHHPAGDLDAVAVDVYAIEDIARADE